MTERPAPDTSEKSAFELSLERATGESIESLRNTTIEERRKRVEAQLGKPMRVVSHWPFVGRQGHVRVLTSEEINKMVDEALK